MKRAGSPWLLLWTLLALLLLQEPARAESISGRVVGVVDGDTLDVLTPAKELVRIRLVGIDAPEKGQAFGQVAKKALSDLAFDRWVTVETGKRDRYDRRVGKVLVGGTDINLEMAARGFAWHFKRYQKEQSPADQQLYDQAERAARGAHRGLWADREPVAPWDFRAQRRASKAAP